MGVVDLKLVATSIFSAIGVRILFLLRQAEI